ncbi:WbqC family protein [uncultured Porphyromonas sp.]|uniref:WbqC family protein n=1 Tax=uncultured Porphyromonas sp. TaxID=159274 RepID=UPI0026207469|nr:WbqC family protein [uncultured Porphyromonas sp.]
MLSLPTLFAPAILHLRLMMDHPEAVICVGEQYQKQTLRNRTYFLTPQGATPFTIPVERFGYPSPATSEISLAEHDHWRHRLEEALRSSYCSTPYWQYYEDQVISLCRCEEGGRLMDFNQRWLAFILGEWDIPLPSVVAEWSRGLDHHAEVARPSSLEGHQLPKYWQVFEDQNGFIPNLSALDLLFHLGLEGRLYLNKL